MTGRNPLARPKVKGDTFFLPDGEGGVYFRNNEGSFRMEGATIAEWIETLLPVFDGESTIGEITEGLPPAYQERVYEIACILQRNGFIRDASQDLPHDLSDSVLKQFAQQIEFLDQLGNSGAYRFQKYRRTKVLAIGAGPFFLSLVHALYESGLPCVHGLTTSHVPTNRQRLQEIIQHFRKTDAEVEFEERLVPGQGSLAWETLVQPFDYVIYVAENGGLEELRMIQKACRAQHVSFFPALCTHRVGMAGPLVEGDSGDDWESAWRRLHGSELNQDSAVHTFSSTAGAMLANVLVFVLLKRVGGVAAQSSKTLSENQFYLLNLETLEGSWHPFLAHPAVVGFQFGQTTSLATVSDLTCLSNLHPNDKVSSEPLLNYFASLTSPHSGIFHVWDEEDLAQLPLPQCRVQVVDVLSVGPATLLPKRICSGFTHDEARREAGLQGLEEYVSRAVEYWTDIEGRPEHSGSTVHLVRADEFIGVGVGETVSEGVCRGLETWLFQSLKSQLQKEHEPCATPIEIANVQDEHTKYYLQALSTMAGAPRLATANLFGFPVAWVGVAGYWYGTVALDTTRAFRKVLQGVLQTVQGTTGSTKSAGSTGSTGTTGAAECIVSTTSVRGADVAPRRMDVPQCSEISDPSTVGAAMETLKSLGKHIAVVNLFFEPFLREKLAGAFGVVVREGEPT